MRILHVINSLNIGGAERLIADSLPIYQDKGLVVDLLVLKESKTAFYNSLKLKSRGKISFLTNGSLYNPFLILRIISFLRGYDLVHIHLFPALYWVVLAKIISRSKVRLIYTEHSTENRRRNNCFFRLADRFIYKYIEHIGAISDSTKSNLVKHLRCESNRISVINNGISMSAFKVDQNCEDLSFFSPDDFILIQVSSFRESKDQKTIIRSLLHLPREIKLLLAGDGPLRIECEQFALQCGVQDRVLFLGLRDDVPALLTYADVCILSSNNEGFGLAIVEGMACRKPCISSNIPGVREIVENYGMLFEKGNDKDLSRNIMKLFNDKEYYSLIANRCFERSKDFEIEKMVENYIRIYSNN